MSWSINLLLQTQISITHFYCNLWQKVLKDNRTLKDVLVVWKKQGIRFCDKWSIIEQMGRAKNGNLTCIVVSPDRKGDDSDIYDMADLNTKKREADFFTTDNLIDVALLL